MSAKLSGMVFDRYPVGGGEMLLALKLADNAHDDGTHIFPSVANMAEKTRQSVRAVQYQLRRMQQSGWLILVRAARGGRNTAGYPAEYRINPDWINGADFAPIDDDAAPEEKGAETAPIKTKERVQNGAEKGATDDGKGAKRDIKGCKAFAPEPSVNHQQPPKNHQPARRASRVASHEQIRKHELPEEISADVWSMWCEHREAKHNDAPWTPAAAAISVKRLLALAAGGQSPEVTVEEAVLRGWTGLFPVKPQTVVSTPAGCAQTLATDWWRTSSGIEARGRQLGVQQSEGEPFMRFKARVFKAAGPGEWMEDMLRTVGRESPERYEQLYAYFNDLARDKNGNTEAA